VTPFGLLIRAGFSHFSKSRTEENGVPSRAVNPRMPFSPNPKRFTFGLTIAAGLRGESAGGPRACGTSFRVTLRSQPPGFAVSRQPFVCIGLAYETLDVPNFSTGTVGFNLPIAIGDALRGKDDAGRFAHSANMTPNRADS
jgi:hypothetical protein